ncbi:MAG: 16S rRNA (adenine(1518)-N(6)/adenine(1519)-N(6))-dimethyltransferase RsmA [Clostridia bacterium]|nr:16S rRNA (adenine(1518)-N(6)/adenine(1519)-N(6))-dimethyltransferase RsmA [Clostridia bacterium]
MASYGFSAKKALGQNFLSDMNIVRNIVDAADVGTDDLVIEVGPGLGVMTALLAEKAGCVIAIEIDRELAPILEPLVHKYPCLQVIYDDVMRTDIGKLIAEKREAYPDLKRVKIVANLPYYITTPIIMMFLEQYASILTSLTFMVQKEVARRLVSPPGSGEYGAISVAVAYYSDASVCFDVPASCFVPRPKVDSSVVNMSVYPVPPIVPRSPDNMFRLVRAAFAQRRKMLVNAISNAAFPGVSKERVSEALDKLGIFRTIRGEMLGVKEYAALSDELFE